MIIGKKYVVYNIQDTKSELSHVSLEHMSLRTPKGSYRIIES